MSLTITEALAEIKTVAKRAQKKREFVNGFLFRQDGLKDPLEKDGGSADVIQRERQALADLDTRLIELRRGIQSANNSTVVTINGTSRTISDWLTWRKDVAPAHQQFLASMSKGLSGVRDMARKQGLNILPSGATGERPQDIIVNINESELATEIETLTDTLGQLDGQLSLKNATVQIGA